MSVSSSMEEEKMGVDELELMHEYADAFGKGDRYHYYIFSKGGFTDALKECAKRGEVTLASLEDVYG